MCDDETLQTRLAGALGSITSPGATGRVVTRSIQCRPIFALAYLIYYQSPAMSEWWVVDLWDPMKVISSTLLEVWRMSPIFDVPGYPNYSWMICGWLDVLGHHHTSTVMDHSMNHP